MVRCNFLTQLVLGILVGFLVVGCGQDDDAASLSGSTRGIQPIQAAECSSIDPSIIIAGNHRSGHSITVGIDNVIEKRGGIYILSSGSDVNEDEDELNPHTHTLPLSVGDMETLNADLTITPNTSLNAGHSHPVTISCGG